MHVDVDYIKPDGSGQNKLLTAEPVTKHLVMVPTATIDYCRVFLYLARRYIKERLKQTRTKSNPNLFNI